MRGVPLEEIASATKISVRSLQALEAEEFSKLPGGIFTRSFIRAYARYLGLDEETVIGEYQVIAPAREDVDLSRMTHSKPRPPKETSRTPVVGLLIAVLLLAGGYAIFRYSHRTVESPVGAPNSNRLASAPAPSAQQPLSATAPATTAATPPAGSPPPSETGQGATNPNPQDASKSSPAATPPAPRGGNAPAAESGLVLQVAANEQAWVAVEADGKTVLQRILKPNDIETFKAKDSFDVRTGNAQGIILTLNGETLKPLGHRGETKTVHLTHDDLKNVNP